MASFQRIMAIYFSCLLKSKRYELPITSPFFNFIIIIIILQIVAKCKLSWPNVNHTKFSRWSGYRGSEYKHLATSNPVLFFISVLLFQDLTDWRDNITKFAKILTKNTHFRLVTKTLKEKRHPWPLKRTGMFLKIDIELLEKAWLRPLLSLIEL